MNPDPDRMDGLTFESDLHRDGASGGHELDSSIAFSNGRWVRRDQLALPLDDVGLRQGIILVERLRTYGGQLWQWIRHRSRLSSGCEGCGIKIHPDRWDEVVQRLLRQNADRIANRDVAVVLLATPGQSDVPTMVAYLDPINEAAVERRRQHGQPVVVTDYQLPSSDCWPREWKIRSRPMYYLADRAARSIDPDAVGLLIDHDAAVLDCSVASVAIVQNGCIVMPPPERALPSVSTMVVGDIAKDLGVPVDRKTFGIAELYDADEVWLMGTTTGLWFANRLTYQRRTEVLSKQVPPLCRAFLQQWVRRTSG